MDIRQEPTAPSEKIKDYYGDEKIEAGDLVRYEGQLFRAVSRDTGYTIRQYYSHETLEKGPGPGWDTRFSVLEKYGVQDSSELPDQPYSRLELEPIIDKT